MRSGFCVWSIATVLTGLATDEVHLLLEVPVVKNHPHRDHVRCGQRIVEEVQRLD
jgi:hypothetical protein